MTDNTSSDRDALTGDLGGTLLDAPAGQAATALGLPGTAPSSLGELCALGAALVEDATVEVVVDLEDGPHRLCVHGTPGEDLRDEEGRFFPILTEEGAQLGTLRVRAASFPAGVEKHFATVADAVARAVELEALRSDNFDLEERVAVAEETLNEAAGQLVHDVNNPLAAAAMALEIARDEVGEGLVAQLLDRAVNSTTRMKTMVTDLLAFSATPVPGSASLRQALDRLRDEFSGLPVADFALGDVDVDVPLSPGDLELVLVALFDNAVKFARPDEAPQVHVEAAEDGGVVRIDVSDSGRGIAEGERERVFTPTLRLDRKVPGMGLGLAAVRRLVQAAGGRVAVLDSPLGGVRVRLELPRTGAASSGV